MTFWTEKEVNILVEAIEKGKPISEIALYFPNRTWDSIRSKVRALKTKGIRTESNEVLDDDGVITFLRKENEELKEEIKRLSRIVSDYNYIANKIISHIKPFPPPPIPKFTFKTSPKEQEAVALFSDCQIGQEVTYEEMGGLEEYNFDIFVQRLDFWAKKVVRIVELHRKAYAVKNLNIFGLGDYCEGIDEKFAWRTADPYKQVVVASEEIASKFRFLSANFETVRVIWKRGNHGTLHKNLYYTPANLDMILGQLIKAKLADCKNIQFEIPEPFWTIVEVQGKRFMLIHGSEIKSWLGFPSYGQERLDSKLSRSLRGRKPIKKSNNTLFTDEEVQRAIEMYEYDYLVHGHHHNIMQFDAGMGERICNGAFVGSTPYALSLGYCNRPSQLLFGVHPDWGITWRYPIRLDRLED